MKKKITALLLAVTMGLSFIVSAFATDTLKRVPSTIPGTDKKYNYVENITVKIPGTNVTFDFEKVADFVLFNETYENRHDAYSEDVYKGRYDIPTYRFTIFESEGKAKINQNEWFGSYFKYENINMGEGHYCGFSNLEEIDGCSYNKIIDMEYLYDGDKIGYLADGYEIVIDSSNVCHSTFDFRDGKFNNPVAVVEILCLNNNGKFDFYGNSNFNESFYLFDKCDKSIDISTLDVNYTPDEEYKITDGANAVVNADTKSLKITADGDFSKFTGVNIDGKTVDSSNYTASKGSTVVEFKGEYLKTLSTGKHTVEICFTDGKAATQLEIKKGGKPNSSDKTDKPAKPDVEIPNTDGTSPVTAVFAVMALSGTAVIAYNKKKRLRK